METRSYDQGKVWEYSAMQNSSIICYAPSMITTSGVWQKDDPLNYSLPLFILQLLVIVVTNRIVAFILKPLNQPKIVAEILSGVLVGPSGVSRIHIFAEKVFPLRSIMVLQTMANVGILYFLFLMGVEMEFSMIKFASNKSLIISVASMIFPIVTCTSTYLIVLDKAKWEGSMVDFVIYASLYTSLTSSNMLNRILADRKLLNTDLGRVSMSSSFITDILVWALFVIGAIFTGEKPREPAKIFGLLKVGFSHELLKVFYVVLFFLVCAFVIRPAITWVIKRTPEGENFSDFYICLILAGVMISGFITDAMGTHYIFGAFFFGLTIPNGPLGNALIEKLEEFITTLLLPLYFAICGLKFEVASAFKDIDKPIVLILIRIGKMICTSLVALLQNVPLREGVSLGMLMNNGFLMELILINVALDKNSIPKDGFSVFMFCSIVMFSTTIPISLSIYKPIVSQSKAHRCRTIQMSKGDSELRVLVCIHTSRNVPTMINLMEASHPTKNSPICIYALHLVELTGRVPATLIVHNTNKYGGRSNNHIEVQSDHIISAFENYERQTTNVIILPLTAISPYSTMHEDICNVVEDKYITLIIVPFHKQQTVDGGMEVANPAFRGVNQNILANAPCSVGILIDRGFTGFNNVLGDNNSHNIVVLFFGGPDDREALAYASRMAEKSYVNLTIIRFIQGDDSIDPAKQSNNHKYSKALTEYEREKRVDDDYISDFRIKTVSNQSTTYKENVVNNGEETVTTIRMLDNIYDLYIVGRRQSTLSSLTAGLTEWSECPELGPIGDLLASSDFSVTTSVLVMQQYDEDEIFGE